MMPPDAYLEARRSANYHVQVRIIDAHLPTTFPGDATIRAAVETVFRGVDSLCIGSLVEFAVSTLRSDDRMPTGPVNWVAADCLAKGLWLEVFLNGSPPICSVAMWQTAPIAGPTDTPKMNLTEL